MVIKGKFATRIHGNVGEEGIGTNRSREVTNNICTQKSRAFLSSKGQLH
jgi:hypothetical protein